MNEQKYTSLSEEAWKQIYKQDMTPEDAIQYFSTKFHGVGLKSNHILVGQSHRLCATIALVYLVGRTHCRSKGLWLG